MAYENYITEIEKDGVVYGIMDEEAREDVGNVLSAIEYNEECDRLGLIPYACNESNTNILSVVQNGNEVTVNGTSNATSSQGATKVLLTDHIHSWNSSTTPDADRVYPIQLIAWHSYKIKATIISGARDAGEGDGKLTIRFVNANNVWINPAIEIESNETEGEITYQSNGEYVQLRMFVSRLMTVTNLVIRIEVSDVTTEVALDEKQDMLTFDSTPIRNSTNPVTSGGVYTSVKDQIEHATGATILEFTNGYAIALGAVGSIATLSSPDVLGTRSYTVGNVSHGQKIKCKLTQGSSSYRAYAFLDNNDTILEKASSNNTDGEYTLIAPPNSAKIVINAITDYDHWAVIVSQDLSWNGLYVSLLGDSISSLQGYVPSVPSQNQTYYGPSKNTEYQRSITKPEQMWWYQVISALGGTPLIIDAWSGSSVTQGGGDEGTIEMSAVSRCKNLHAWVQTTSDDPNAVVVTSENIGSMRTSPFLAAYTPAIGDYAKRIDPDIVLSTGGTNDWTYAQTPEAIGTYDAHTSLPDPDGDSPAVTTFREAYATMLCRIQSEYPFALTICCKGFFNMRPYVAKYNGNRNADSGLTIQDYHKAIDEIAAIRACPVVDIWTNGFNKYNYYDTFAGDRSTSTTHPNELGQQMIARNSIPYFRNICAGYVEWIKARNES